MCSLAHNILPFGFVHRSTKRLLTLSFNLMQFQCLFVQTTVRADMPSRLFQSNRGSNKMFVMFCGVSFSLYMYAKP